MFKKHEFTCPDVVYLRSRAKRNQYITLGVYAASMLGLVVWARHEEKKVVIPDTIEEIQPQ